MQSEYKEVVEALENAGWTCCAIESRTGEDPHIEFQKEINGQTIVLIYYSDGKPYSVEALKRFFNI